MVSQFRHVTNTQLRRILEKNSGTITKADLSTALSRTMRAVTRDISNPHIPGPEMARRIDRVEEASEDMRRDRLAECHAALRGVWGELKPSP